MTGTFEDLGRSAARTAAVLAALTLIGACGPFDTSPTPLPTAPAPTAPALTVDGVPVACADEMAPEHCLSRARVGLLSLSPDHPAVVQVVVTCDAEHCDAGAGVGQVIAHFADGTREVVDIGFGRTNQE